MTNTEILANASVCDAAGNVYVTGSFMGTATFGTNVLNSSGGFNYDDVYVVKYDPAGNVIWARRAGGSGKDYGRVITLDGAGGVYVAGTSDSSPAYFGTNFFNLYVQSLFIARYDANGNVLWAGRGGCPPSPGGDVTVKSIARDADNNVIIGGSFTGNPNFGGNFNGQTGNQTIYLTNHNTTVPTASQDTFLAKFDASGSLLWAINPGAADNDYTYAVAVDSAGAVYASGGYNKSNILGSVTYTNSFEGMFLAKFSSAGNLVWSSNLSDATNSNPGHGLALVVDAADRVTLSFQANNSSTPFAYRGTNYVLSSGAINLLAQFDTSGNLTWLKQSPLTGGSATSLALDQQNNLYLGGNAGLINGSVPALSLSIVKYTSNGQPVWTNNVPKSPVGITLGLPSVSVDASNIAHVTTTLTGSAGNWLTVGWTNIYPFASFGYNQLLFSMASNFVAVPPVFVQQPTNMVYQPPRGLTNSAQARAWPAPRYYWYMNGAKLATQTNFILALGPTGFTNQTGYFVVASNSYGMATSIVVNAQAELAFAPLPPTNVYVLVNTTLAISGGATGTTAIAYQWRFNGTNLAGANSSTLALPNIATNQAGSYTLVISNATGVLTSAPPSVVTVLPIGSVDPYWTNQANSYLNGLTGLIRSPDGSYYAVNGINAVKILPDGTLDTNGFINILSRYYRWNNGTPGDQFLGPLTIVRESSGKLIVGGTFKVYYPTPATFTNVNRLVRLNPDGTLDGDFNVGLGATNTVNGQDFSKIECVIPLANGQYLVGGTFNRFNDVAVTNLVRLNNDGSLDNTFPGHTCKYTAAGTSIGYVHTLALQADGKILVGGEFGVFDGVANCNLTRLNADGTLDGTFVQSDLPAPGFGRVRTVVPLADGKILVGGAWNNQTNTGVLRFNTNGVRDATWAGSMPGETSAISLLPGNKLILGGNGFVRRTTYDGVADPAFNSGTAFSGQQVNALIPEPTGNVMAGGTPFGLRRLLLEPTIVVPSFSSGAGVGVVNGQFQLSACGGVDGQVIVVQASTDLVNWQNVSTNIVAGGCISYTDTQTPPLPGRYYRLAVLQ